MRLALLGVATLTLASHADANKGAILIPPVEVDLGVAVPVGATDLPPSQEILAGVHWASLAWKPTRLDVGLGYVGSFRTLDDPMRFADREVHMHGGYFSLATSLARGNHWRTWLAARGELFRVFVDDRDFSAVGGALRVATELYGSGAFGDRGAAAVGTFALGIYVEATYRDVPAELGPVGFSSGVSCRLPFIVAGG